MKIPRAIDRIRPPISDFMSMAICTGIGLLISYFYNGEKADGLVLGIVIGAFFALVLKRSLECSDRAGLMAATGKLKKDDRRKLFSLL